MLRDLEALTPPLIVCAAFLIGLLLFLRRQMGPARPSDAAEEEDIPDRNSHQDHPSARSADSAAGPSSDPRHSSR